MSDIISPFSELVSSDVIDNIKISINNHQLSRSTNNDDNISTEFSDIESSFDISSDTDDELSHNTKNKIDDNKIKNQISRSKKYIVKDNYGTEYEINDEDKSKIARAKNKIDDDFDESEEENEEIQINTIDIMKQDFSHPDADDENIQYKLYKKREYYYNKIPTRPEITDDVDYAIIKDYRDNTCARPFALQEHQSMLSNIINPDTPYKGVIVFHGLGSGKCVHKDTCVVISNHCGDNIQKISDVWKRYNTDEFIDNHGGHWSTPSELLFIDSLNDKINRIEKRRILRLYREKVVTLLKRVQLENGNSIVITQIHKLYVKKFDNTFWHNHFNIDDEIAVKNDSTIKWVRIVNISYFHYDDYVYDFEVEEHHNYVANNIVCHNTCVGVAIAEKFKELVQKYNTKIHILVPGPIIKESWKHHLIQCTGETYKKYQNKYEHLDKNEQSRQNKSALVQALQYYRLMSYRSFYKRVLGDKVVDQKTLSNNKSTKITYRKTLDGDFERDIAVDRIYNLNNSVLIIDEAHNLTGNAYGQALRHIIDNSTNLKVVLMSATPIKNLGSDIVELVNFLRPKNSPMERDKIFNSHKNHLMDFVPNGLEYFKNMINGYISHVRGSDPLTFAKRVDKGEIPEGLLFTKMNRCTMLKFQREIYDHTVIEFDDALDRASEAVSNFAFPILGSDKNKLMGAYGREGLITVKDNVKASQEILNKRISEMLGVNNKNWLVLTDDGKNVTGDIYKMPYLQHFSIKFYTAMKKLSRLVAGKKGAKTAFIYSNLVKVGIEIFQEILKRNGYIEYQQDQNYQIKSDTICYYCGKKYKEHDNSQLKQISRAFAIHDSSSTETLDTELKGGKNDESDDESDDDNDEKSVNNENSSSEYEKTSVNNHKFYPATFISITGKSEDGDDIMNEEKKKILDDVFNDISNKDGRFIKFVLGSKVMNEGISMKNVGEVHILDVYFNLGKVDQVVGRAIRWCSHYKVMSDTNVFPYVNVYKYVVTLGDSKELSSEEELYRKAELKYILINKLERAMKERAIDCPLNMNGNIFNEEIRQFKNCSIHGNNKCPAICNYTQCDYKCDDVKLNYEYYDPERKIYKTLKKDELDYSTFTSNLAEAEIEYAKSKIKNMFITSPVYTLKDIVEYVKNSYNDEKQDLFDEFFVYKALDQMLPISENDFNNFKDTIVDKNNTQGYLIYRDEYYIFQPFDQNEDVPLYYRINNMNSISSDLSLYNYLKSIEKKKKKVIKKKDNIDTNMYDFDGTLDYYDEREEYDLVGIIDKEHSRRGTRSLDEMKDVFKIRDKLPKILDKKRGTGIPSLKGAVCVTAKTKGELEKIALKLGGVIKSGMGRQDICNVIEERMLEREKYATDKDKNKMTYVRLPSNHPKYQFPYNLEDRVKYIIANIRKESEQKLDIKTNKETNKTGPNKGKPVYNIIIKKDKNVSEKIFKKYKFETDKSNWIIKVD